MQFFPVARVDEIPPGEARAFVLGRWEIAVFNIGGAFYATEGTCPHQGGPLAEGWIDGFVVTCPWHAWCFDVRTGAMTLSDLCRLERFAVQIDGDVISVSSEPLGT